MGEWISVEDRLPEDYETVLVQQRPYEHALFGFFSITEWHTSDGVGGYVYVTNDVTHWMPLPEIKND